VTPLSASISDPDTYTGNSKQANGT
jgi:hypothetical protein